MLEAKELLLAKSSHGFNGIQKEALDKWRASYPKVRPNNDAKVLTFYLARDRIDPVLFSAVVNQSHDQDIIIVSAIPISAPPSAQNYVVVPPKNLMCVSLRVAYSINMALAHFWDPNKYSFFFKVDDDVLLPPNYLRRLISASNERPIIGTWGGMLIEGAFFQFLYGGRWEFCYTDDVAMRAHAYAFGFVPGLGDGMMGICTPSDSQKISRFILYGKGKYQMGYPLWSLLLSMACAIKNFPRPDDGTKEHIKDSFFTLLGYLSMVGKPRLLWNREFRERTNQELFLRLSNKLVKSRKTL